MTEVELFSLKIRGRLLLAYNAVALLIVLAVIVARLTKADIWKYEWGLAWGVAAGMWFASTIMLFIVKRSGRSTATSAPTDHTALNRPGIPGGSKV